MSTLNLPKQYEDGQILFAADLDVILDEFENFFNVTQINDGNIQDDGLTGSIVIRDATVTTDKLASNSVNTSELATDAIATADINNSAVTTAKLATDSVGTSELAADSITTAKIVDNEIGKTKLVSNYVFSGTDLTTFTIDSTTTTPTTIPNLQCTITTTGNPVEIRAFTVLHPTDADNSNLTTGGRALYKRDSQVYPVIEIYRDSTLIYSTVDQSNLHSTWVANGTSSERHIHPTIGPFLDAPGAGTYVYSIKGYFKSVAPFSGLSSSMTLSYMRMFVREL